ncbi:MAG TPA: hypothetical protein EYP85_03355, partial [Armatimonadetes bacterium]|nr:hypothetical protein [Armatimonadota bacterium]
MGSVITKGRMEHLAMAYGCVSPLRRLLRVLQRGVRRLIAYVMGTSLQPVRVEELLGQLHSPWFWRRWRAVRGLRQFPEPRVVEAV